MRIHSIFAVFRTLLHWSILTFFPTAKVKLTAIQAPKEIYLRDVTNCTTVYPANIPNF
jgi:hypothetical protein